MGQSIFALEQIDPNLNPSVARLAEEILGSPASQQGQGVVDRLLAFAAEAEQQLQWAEQRIAKLESIAETDELTGLLNRRGLRRQMARLLARAHRHGEFGTILFVDIDDLGGINDRYDRATGDAVLRRLAKILTTQIRAGDLLARYGGDEFAVVLERCNQANAHMRADSIRTMLEEQPLQIGQNALTIPISIGLAPYGPNGTADQVFAGRQNITSKPE